MAPAKLHQVFAPPLYPPAIGPYLDRIVVVDCPGLRPKYNLLSHRAVSQREILILATRDLGIEPAQALKQISGNGHIPSRTEIPNSSRTGNFGYDTIVKSLPQTDKRPAHRVVREAYRADYQRSRPKLMRSQMIGQKIAAYRHVIVDKNKDLSPGKSSSGIAGCRSLNPFQARKRHFQPIRRLRYHHRRTGIIVYDDYFEVAGPKVLLY
jgi:hypothetical protein